MPSKSNQKVVLITGGSRGIGKATVEKFKQQSWRVATCGTSPQRLTDNPADLKLSCDVSKADEVRQGVEKVIRELGRIDVLVNNAGLAGNDPLSADSSDDLWNRIIDVNLHGTYYMCKQVMPHLPNNDGRIINIASVLALKGVPDATAYCTAKHAVLGLTRSLAHYLAPRRITVNAVCPGWVRTEMAAERMNEIGLTESSLAKSVPLGRLIEPHEVADYIYFLATSPGSIMITGQALILDGGSLA